MVLDSSIGNEIPKKITTLAKAFIVTFSLLLAAVQAAEGAIKWMSKGPTGGLNVFVVAIAPV